jgi:hypothetical protein
VLSLRTPPAAGENHPSAGDWMLALSAAVVPALGGVWLGLVWFGSVAGA